MKHIKKILYGIGVLFLVCAAIFFYKTKDYLMHYYYLDKVEEKYQESLEYCNDSYETYRNSPPEETLSALNQCHSILSEGLKYFEKHRKHILFGFDEYPENDFLFDIGITYAHIAIQYEKMGDKKQYDEYIQKALSIIPTVWPTIKNEYDLRQLIKKFESNKKKANNRLQATAKRRA